MRWCCGDSRQRFIRYIGTATQLPCSMNEPYGFTSLKSQKQFWQIFCGPWTASIAYRHGLWMIQIDTRPWSHTCLGHMVLIGLQLHVCKWVKIYIFWLSSKLTSHDIWPSFVTSDLMNMYKFLRFTNKSSLVSIECWLSKWGEFSFWANFSIKIWA